MIRGEDSASLHGFWWLSGSLARARSCSLAEGDAIRHLIHHACTTAVLADSDDRLGLLMLDGRRTSRLESHASPTMVETLPKLLSNSFD
jgi:hypothetical protein